MHGATPAAHTPLHKGTSRRTLLRAAVAAPLLGGLAACSGKEEEPPADPNAPATVEFFWWGGEARAKLTEQALDLYTSKKPHITITRTWQAFTGYYDKLATISAGGNAPDIFQIDDNGLDRKSVV